MVANGETPKWDKDSKKWVNGTTAEASVGGTQSSAPVTVSQDPQANEEPGEEEDLPF